MNLYESIESNLENGSKYESDFAIDNIKPEEVDNYKCSNCGNTADTDGFYPVDGMGNEVEPDEDWKNKGSIYACAVCGKKHRIVEEVKEDEQLPDEIVEVDLTTKDGIIKALVKEEEDAIESYKTKLEILKGICEIPEEFEKVSLLFNHIVEEETEHVEELNKYLETGEVDIEHNIDLTAQATTVVPLESGLDIK